MLDAGKLDAADRGGAEQSPGIGGRALRLVIADPHQLFRDCLASALAKEPELEVVEKCGDGPEVLAVLAEGSPDVLLLGVGASCEAALGLTREVCGRFPNVKVLLLGRPEAEGGILGCLEAGASGFLFRNQPLAELRTALAGVSRGDTVCTPRVVQSLYSRLADLGRRRRRTEKLDYLTLTPRELEILHLVSEGLSNQEIAGRLFLSVHTVKNHIHKILETLEVPSRWAAVRHAVERGWLPDRRQR